MAHTMESGCLYPSPFILIHTHEVCSTCRDADQRSPKRIQFVFSSKSHAKTRKIKSFYDCVLILRPAQRDLLSEV